MSTWHIEQANAECDVLAVAIPPSWQPAQSASGRAAAVPWWNVCGSGWHVAQRPERLVVRRVTRGARRRADRRARVVGDLAVARGVAAGERVGVRDLRRGRPGAAHVTGGALSARPVHAGVTGSASGAEGLVAGGSRGDDPVVTAGAGGRRAVHRVVVRAGARRGGAGAHAVTGDAGLAVAGRAEVDSEAPGRGRRPRLPPPSLPLEHPRARVVDDDEPEAGVERLRGRG